MSDSIRWQSGTLRDRFDDMRLNLDRRRGCRPGRKLRIERSGNAVSALRRKGRRGIEESEIARMCHVYDPMFHLRDAPGEELIKRSWGSKIEFGEFFSEYVDIERRHNGPLNDTRMGTRQLLCQPVVQSASLGAWWKQRGGRDSSVSVCGHAVFARVWRLF
jgi:hypothetical protein